MVSEDELVIGIGVAVCDSDDNVVYKVGKQYEEAGLSGQVAEIVAVIHGLMAAVELDLKRVVFCFDYRTLYQFLIGQWTPRHPTIVALVTSVNEIRENFEYSAPALVARDDVEFAFELAREAMFSQVNRPSDSSSQNKINETCDICLEDRDVSLFFTVENCSHQYCFSCMKQPVETKLLNGMVPKCLFEGCKSELNIESCRNFLTRKLIKLMAQRLKEASVPVTKKVYCPYRRCSFLMSQEEVFEFSSERAYNIESGFRLCVKCERKFCINCKVPWHYGLNCRNYKRRNPNPSEEDTELNILANRNLWRQCVKCNHMIELDAGCYHMICRCGYEFCYTCGAEWKDKRASCSCPLWDEQNILDEDYESDEENYYFDDEDLDEDESDSDDYN